ncbi:MAG TPA: transcription-repair coupling factor [Thermosynechococcus sp. M3746_W2019_013]|jgi:transcription-repair coupling factor (superfamily II helicase)|uniref:transcription-repair coupling factor n=1 Tax=Thermosynechococcus sp. M3746_W2019_013 TaxID=2747806 RepID=UPI001A0CF19F|nr:transcription-repair coupling factor [Thermosynechococcus sp. M3746_W2019_013]HIK23530.1 transcription-repair coupling factor [Thermosynechococcus sp. M3746_W2019_013]
MSLMAIPRSWGKLPLTAELLSKLQHQRELVLTGMPRLVKGLVATTLAQQSQQSLCVITSTLEEGGRWAAQLELMGWDAVLFYPTSAASPYDLFDLEAEMVWGQLQVLVESDRPNIAIVTTERALQPHLPPPEQFRAACLTWQVGQEYALGEVATTLAALGYERVSLVETEGQWSRRGDIVDIFPVSAELPVRLQWFGDEIESIREFDPATQRSLHAEGDRLDVLEQVTLTPISFTPLIAQALRAADHAHLIPEDEEGLRRYLGLAFPEPASLLDYLPAQTLIAVDEPPLCAAHGDRWYEQTHTYWQSLETPPPPIHRPWSASAQALERFQRLHLYELASEGLGLNLSARAVPAIPHQFGRLAATLREERDKGYTVWLVSAQPSRSVALLQEHDCPAQFVPNPKDFLAIDKLQQQRLPIALKASGLAEISGFILPTFRTVLVSDREFFGQQNLVNLGYVRKRRRAAAKQVDLNKLQPGDYVVHRQHGIGQFLRLETLTFNNETREYLVLQYADGILRVAADQLNSLSRYRTQGDRVPQLNKLTGNTWERTKARVRKAIQKVAVDLLQLYAQRAQQQGFAFPPDTPWQQEMEDSFPYQPTPDQLKAIQEVKADMESDRPMDRLVCGDVGFGKTEVAIRAIFKAVMAGKQVAVLAPTTILTQQHYHTLKERFAPYPIQVGLLNRFRSERERQDILQKLKTGEIDVVVGTHQLLSKTVKFRDLGLLVVDEEQRFGVNQKEKIKTLKTQVDVLTLSATPIPRTLYMALSGVREMSLITTPPPSRRPIQTHLAPYDPETVRSAIRQELDRGGQVFYVVPRVEGIEEVAAKLQGMVPGARILIAHGQMPEGELESTMLGFSNGEADLLVCTTIIESGLDIPRVNTILVEDAQQFGLAQLYQLRGRVGRAGIQAHAWLFYPRQEVLTDAARQRLRAIQEFTQLGSGYQLAMRDMEIRGVGNLLGVEQHGQLDSVGFDLYVELLEEAIAEIRGQEIPTVDDTQVDLNVTAFIPADYMPDLAQKMAAYRAVSAAATKEDLMQLAAEWSDRYGPLPKSVQQLLRVVELKQLARQCGIRRIRPEGKQHVILETPMAEPAWKLLLEQLPSHLQSRFVYSQGKVTVRGLGIQPMEKQLEQLIDWFRQMKTINKRAQGAVA